MSIRLTCRELIEFLDDYVEGLLAATRRAAFEEHLRVCDPCVRYLAGYRSTLRAVALAHADSEAASADAPGELIEAILASRRA